MNAATATDPEGDIPVLQYEWTNVTQGTVLGNSSLLIVDPALATGSDELVCTVIAEDSIRHKIRNPLRLWLDLLSQPSQSQHRLHQTLVWYLILY